MRSSSAWGGNDSDRPQDLVALLRSPLFVGVAVVIVAAFWFGTALNAEDWIEVAPIPVLQEREVVYLEDDGIFVLWNDGAPYGVDERYRGGRVVYCASQEIFASSDGAIFDLRGAAVDKNENLRLLDARLDGHLVFVNGDRSEAGYARERASPEEPRLCAPPASATGILR